MPHRTEVWPTSIKNKLTYQDPIFALGSCFVQEIGTQLAARKHPILTNPFGTQFHPLGFENTLARAMSCEKYTADEIFQYRELYFSWDHAYDFSDLSVEKTLCKINDSLLQANEFIGRCTTFLFTLGTAWVYELKDAEIVVNHCHKVPQKMFLKRLLSVAETTQALQNCIALIKDVNPQAQIIFTISPVRHIKDGLTENHQSKGTLHLAMQKIKSTYPSVHYFPSYEMVLDDLRDYRYFKKDLVHPNELAVEYIWGKFADSYFSPTTLQLYKKVEKINRALQHVPIHPDSLAHKKFLYDTLKAINQIKQELPKGTFENEIISLKKQLHDTD